MPLRKKPPEHNQSTHVCRRVLPLTKHSMACSPGMCRQTSMQRSNKAPKHHKSLCTEHMLLICLDVCSSIHGAHTNDGIFARGQAQGSDDCFHTFCLCSMVHVLRKPQHGCIVKCLIDRQRLIEQVVLQTSNMQNAESLVLLQIAATAQSSNTGGVWGTVRSMYCSYIVNELILQ